VPLVIGFGEALAIAGRQMKSDAARLTELRNRLFHAIMERCPHVRLNGSLEHRLPANLNLSFAYVEGEAILTDIKEVALSTGSACTSAASEPSYVLRAIGVANDWAQGSIRFGLGRFNTEEEVDHVAKRTVEAVDRLRRLSPLYDG